MAEPQPEEEVVLQRHLRALGCPYSIGDDRTMVWIEGYRAGLKGGKEIAHKALIDHYAERG